MYLFGTAGLVGVMLLGSKPDQRQAQLDANFTRRQELLAQRAGLKPAASGEQINTEETLAPEQEARYVTFSPLYIAIAIATACGWVMFWRQHFYSPVSPAEESREEETSS
jgi:hypothetical protein